MKRHLFYGIIFLLASGLMLTTCHKEYFELNRLSTEIEIQPQLVAPLLYGSMTVMDIVERVDSAGYVNEFEDGLLYLVYSDTVVNVKADTVFEVPDKFYKELYIDPEIDDPIFIGSDIGDTTHFLKTEVEVFELEGDDRLDSVVIKGGDIKINVSSSFKHTGLLTISSNQIKDRDRVPFSTTFVISDPTGGFIDSITLDSDNYYVEPFVVNDSNMINIDYDLALINSGNPVSPGELCEINTSFLNLNFYGAYGYIDSRDLIDESGSVDIPLWAENPDLATLIFADPRIHIFTSSSVGIPFEIDFDSVIATAEDGTQEILDIYDGNTLNIFAPGLDRIGDTVNTNIRINNTTSNISDFLAIAPASISYSVKGRTKPGTGAEEHFVLDESKFALALEFLLPLDFKSSGFALKDTIDFEVGADGVDTTLLKEAQVSVTTLNELPIELELQVYMLDANHSVIDSVFDGDAIILGASLVDDQGILTQAVEETSVVTFPIEKLATLQEVFYMQVEARLITSEMGDQFVKIYSDYSLDFKLSMVANFRINTRDL
ncbi:MAG: hypothetical protein ABFS38_00800 [Bacteroidota bacterium]